MQQPTLALLQKEKSYATEHTMSVSKNILHANAAKKQLHNIARMDYLFANHLTAKYVVLDFLKSAPVLKNTVKHHAGAHNQQRNQQKQAQDLHYHQQGSAQDVWYAQQKTQRLNVKRMNNNPVLKSTAKNLVFALEK